MSTLERKSCKSYCLIRFSVCVCVYSTVRVYVCVHVYVCDYMEMIVIPQWRIQDFEKFRGLKY